MGLTKVTGKGITDGTIFDVDVHASAAIAGSKINPNFGSQNIETTGNASIRNILTISGSGPSLTLTDIDNNPDYRLQNDNGKFRVLDYTNDVDRFVVNTDGHIDIAGNVDFGAGIDVTGNITVSGTVDGRDLATDGTKLDGIESNATADQTASEIVALIADQTIAPSTIDMEDNEKIKLGNSDDLEIYHSGSHSRFLDNGAGKIQFGSDTGVEVLTANFATQIALFDPTQILLKENTSITGNLAVSGTVDGVDIATRDTLFGGLTSSSGVLTDGVTATTQSASDNSTKVATTAYIDTAISNLIDSSPGTLNTLNELAAALGDDPNFSTTITNSIAAKMPLAGGTFTGDVTFDGATAGRDIFFDRSANSLVFKDNAFALFGTSGDLQIFHDGVHSFIQDLGTGALILKSNQVNLYNAAGNEPMLIANENGSVDIYHDNSKKVETASTGLVVSGNVSLGDDNGGDTLRRLVLGAGNDLIIYHDGSNSYIKEQGTGNLKIQSANTIDIEKDDGTDVARFHPDGEVQLFHNGGQKFATKSYGAAVTGQFVTTSDITIESGGDLFLKDNGIAYFGTGNDLQIYHDGNNSWIKDSGTGYLILATSRFQVNNAASDEEMIVAIENAQVELFYNNTKRLETTSSGVNVTGALTVNGSAVGGGNPTGTIISFAGSSAPTGYLKANGDTIPNGSGTVQGITTDYSDLYAIVGSSLPDLRGEFIRGVDDSRGVDSGRSMLSSQGSQNLSHNHRTNTTIGRANTNSYDLRGSFNGEERSGRPTGIFSTGASRNRDFDGGPGDVINFDGRHRHDTNSNGGSEARPRNVAVLMCIKY